MDEKWRNFFFFLVTFVRLPGFVNNWVILGVWFNNSSQPFFYLSIFVDSEKCLLKKQLLNFQRDLLWPLNVFWFLDVKRFPFFSDVTKCGHSRRRKVVLRMFGFCGGKVELADNSQTKGFTGFSNLKQSTFCCYEVWFLRWWPPGGGRSWIFAAPLKKSNQRNFWRPKFSIVFHWEKVWTPFT